MIGALVGAGIPEYRAKVYETGLREGGILLGGRSQKRRLENLEHLLEDVGGTHVRAE